MNQGSNPPSGHSGGKGRRRRRGRRGAVVHGAAPQQPGQNRSNGPVRDRARAGQQAASRASSAAAATRENPLGGGIYTAPMDHSYRALQGNNNGNARRPGRGGVAGRASNSCQPDLEPLPANV